MLVVRRPHFVGLPSSLPQALGHPHRFAISSVRRGGLLGRVDQSRGLLNELLLGAHVVFLRGGRVILDLATVVSRALGSDRAVLEMHLLIRVHDMQRGPLNVLLLAVVGALKDMGGGLLL